METNPRDLEWQRRYDEHDTPWDKGAPAPALVSFLRTDAISGRVLVPGCGLGHEVRVIGAHPGCSATGIDLSTTAMAEASKLTSRSEVPTKAEFIVGDFFQLPSELHGSFDWLVEHTCFCAIDPDQRPAYIAAAATALCEGGKLFGIFYLNPDVEAGPPFAVSREELTRLFDSRFRLLEEWQPAETFAGRENREWVRLLQKR
jgi:SAM-dependent methyltransferase